MKKLVIVLVLGNLLMASKSFAFSEYNLRGVAIALDQLKAELANGKMSDNARASQDSISFESLAAAGARVTSYEVLNDLTGKCMVSFKISTGTSKSYRVVNTKESYFSRVCP